MTRILFLCLLAFSCVAPAKGIGPDWLPYMSPSMDQAKASQVYSDFRHLKRLRLRYKDPLLQNITGLRSPDGEALISWFTARVSAIVDESFKPRFCVISTNTRVARLHAPWLPTPAPVDLPLRRKLLTQLQTGEIPLCNRLGETNTLPVFEAVVRTQDPLLGGPHLIGADVLFEPYGVVGALILDGKPLQQLTPQTALLVVSDDWVITPPPLDNSAGSQWIRLATMIASAQHTMGAGSARWMPLKECSTAGGGFACDLHENGGLALRGLLLEWFAAACKDDPYCHINEEIRLKLLAAESLYRVVGNAHYRRRANNLLREVSPLVKMYDMVENYERAERMKRWNLLSRDIAREAPLAPLLRK